MVCDLLTHIEKTALSNADTTGVCMHELHSALIPTHSSPSFPSVSFQSQLLSLSESHPAETLAGIREFLAVEDFREGTMACCLYDMPHVL